MKTPKTIICAGCQTELVIKSVTYNPQSDKTKVKYSCPCGLGGVKVIDHKTGKMILYGEIKAKP